MPDPSIKLQLARRFFSACRSRPIPPTVSTLELLEQALARVRRFPKARRAEAEAVLRYHLAKTADELDDLRRRKPTPAQARGGCP